MEIWHYWIIVGIVLLIAEIITPGFVVAVLGIGCFGAALASWLGGLLWVQLIAFSAVSLICFIFVRPFFMRLLYRAGREKTFGPERLIGRIGRVTVAIAPAGGKGRVKIDGQEWTAVSEDDRGVELDGEVEIKALAGLTLKVSLKGNS